MLFQSGDHFGPFHIQAHLAQGATGDVYRAVDTRTDCEAALKISNRETLLDPRRYERFLREIDALRGLQHPGVQHSVESGRWDKTPYLATKLITGRMLRSLLRHEGPFPVQRALALTRQLADSLEYCHAQQVIHLDLKPENILVTADDVPVIIDFGLALSKTRPASIYQAGTPEYMAPEQIQGHPCDRRTDVYALGAVLYEMLTGQPPFTADDPAEILNKHLYEAVPRLDQMKQGVSSELAAIVARCLQRDPDQRYPNMVALVQDLDNPAQVDVSGLDRLCAMPPKPSFFNHPYVRAVVASLVIFIGIILLGLFLAALRH
jgi:serine/threonine protein kinase